MNHVFNERDLCIRCQSHLFDAIRGESCLSDEEIRSQEAHKARLTPLLDVPEEAEAHNA